jgi:hypothetical protein
LNRWPLSLGEDFEGSANAAPLDRGDYFCLFEKAVATKLIGRDATFQGVTPKGPNAEWRDLACFIREAKY